MTSANIEIKARCPDLARARAVALRLATESRGIDHQVDTYFGTRRGRLKLRESSLTGAHLVPYLRPDGPEPRRSDYQLVPVPDPTALKTLLTEILGEHRVVEKEREIHLHHNVRIHLDRVRELGEFLELEAVLGPDSVEKEELRKVRFLMQELGVRDEDLIDSSYETLMGESGG